MPESATVAVPVGRGASDPRRVASELSASGSAGVEKGWPLRLGVLTAQVGPALVDEVVAAAGAAQRRGGVLSAPAGGFFLLALWLFCGAGGGAPPRPPSGGRGVGRRRGGAPDAP